MSKLEALILICLCSLASIFLTITFYHQGNLSTLQGLYFDNLEPKLRAFFTNVFATAAIGSFFGAAGAAFIIRRSEETKLLHSNIQQHNEAVLYIADMTELILIKTTQIPSIIEHELSALEYVEIGTTLTPHPFSLLKIPEIKKNIRDLKTSGANYKLIQAYNRGISQLQSANDTTVQRNECIDSMLKTVESGDIDRETTIIKLNEIFELSAFFACHIDSALDAFIFTSKELKEISQQFKKDIKYQRVKPVVLTLPDETDKQKSIRITLRELVDKMPQFKDRLKHLTTDTLTK